MTVPARTDLCRITVVGPAKRVDIAVPGYVPFADLFPTVARYAGLEGPEAAAEHGGWVLQRLGEEPFPPGATPFQAGLRDGEMIYLRPHRAQLPPVAFDDVADVIATGLSELPGRWVARDARRVALAVAAAALLAGAVLLVRLGPPWHVPSLAAAVVAVVLLIAVGAVARAAGDSAAATVLGYSAMPYALVAGVLIPARSGSLGQLGSAQLLSGLAAVALTAVLAAAASGRLQLFLGVLIAAVVGVIGAGIEYAVGSLGFAGAAGVMVAPVLALTPLIPSVSFRLAGMALPQVPRHADDLRRDTLTVDGAAVFDRTAAADSFVTGAVAGIGLVGAGAELALALSPGWLPRLMCAVLGVALLLRARVFQGLAQRLWLMVPGYGGLILLALMATVTGSQLRHVAVMLLPLVAGAALVTGVGIWLASARPSPFWGRAADIADMLFVVGLFPLALAVAGVFGDIGHIAG